MTKIEEITHQIEAILRLEVLCSACDNNVDSKKLAKDLVFLIAEAAKQERAEEILEMIDRHDPNTKSSRKVSSAYWGNTLRREIKQILTKKEDE